MNFLIPIFAAIVSIADFGAKNCDAGNCTQSFSAAIEAVHCSGGGKVVVPDGVPPSWTDSVRAGGTLPYAEVVHGALREYDWRIFGTLFAKRQGGKKSELEKNGRTSSSCACVAWSGGADGRDDE